MSNNAIIPFLVGMMLLTGVCNTLLTKYQDMQCVRNCSSPDAARRKNFEQPVWQTAQMFVGEMGCWLVLAVAKAYEQYASRKRLNAGYESVQGDDHRDSSDLQSEVNPTATLLSPSEAGRLPMNGFKVLLLALPAICDIAATTLMNVGLLFVAASIYQMTRGALVLFVGLFSVIFLGRHLGAAKWFSLFIVVAGVAVVGLAGALEQKDATVPRIGHGDTHGIDDTLLNAVHKTMIVARAEFSNMFSTPTSATQTILGVALIALAQIFTAAQFVLEESIMHRYSMSPLAVVGWEGTFGLLVTLIFMLIMHFAYGRTSAGKGGYFDATTGWHEMIGNRAIAISSLLIMISIGGFNFFGLSVTRTVSATSRSTIDTCRTLFIWVVSLGLGWETFKWLQVLGFAGLVYGTFLFNDIISPPGAFWKKRRAEPELLPERPVEHN